jgi:putative FmdB family regulatory protein
MPLYEFECNSCHHQFEELILSSSKTVEECPECHDKNVKKLMSAGSLRTGGGTTVSSSAPAPSCAPAGG